MCICIDDLAPAQHARTYVLSLDKIKPTECNQSHTSAAYLHELNPSNKRDDAIAREIDMRRAKDVLVVGDVVSTLR